MFEANDIFTLTGIAHDIKRLNYRYQIMFNPIKHMFQDANVLDLGSHNGRWSYVACQLGAKHVVGLEKESNLISQAQANLINKGINPTRFEFRQDNVEVGHLPKADIVLCMGLLYYLKDPISLLRTIKAQNPHLLIIDTFCSQYKVPKRRVFQKLLDDLFAINELAVYDSGRRVAYHCFPRLMLL